MRMPRFLFPQLQEYNEKKVNMPGIHIIMKPGKYDDKEKTEKRSPYNCIHPAGGCVHCGIFSAQQLHPAESV